MFYKAFVFINGLKVDSKFAFSLHAGHEQCCTLFLLMQIRLKKRTWLNTVGKHEETMNNIRVTFVIYYRY